MTTTRYEFAFFSVECDDEGDVYTIECKCGRDVAISTYSDKMLGSNNKGTCDCGREWSVYAVCEKLAGADDDDDHAER